MNIARLAFRLVEAQASSAGLWRLLDATGIVVWVGANGSGKSLGAVASRLGTLDGKRWSCEDLDHHHHAGARQHLQECPVCAGAGWEGRRRAGLRAWVEATPEGGLCPEGALLLLDGCEGQRLVYSTVELLGEDGNPHPVYRPLTDYQQLLRIEHADLIFDEVAGVSDASDSSAIPVQVVNWLHQLRKRDVRLTVTTPAYARCSKPIRQVAQVVVEAKAYFPEASRDGRLWRPRRGFVFTAYDAFAFEDFTAGTSEKLDHLARAAMWRPGHRASATYNTLGQVLALGHVTEAGLCSACGGTRSRPRCACKGDHLTPGVELQVVETVSAGGARTRAAVPVGEADTAAP